MALKSSHAVLDDLHELADHSDAAHLQRYFKTGAGEYGEGDVFLGIRMPVLRQLARTHRDLVDCSAEHIMGSWLHHRDRLMLHRLAASPSVWERRIAILSTFHFIRIGDYGETLALAEALLHDGHDLIHKAVGWMLREVAGRERETAETYLMAHHRHMPRTMLRYAIEKFLGPLRKRYLRDEV